MREYVLEMESNGDERALTSTYGRQRFTIAHELYHLFFHEDFKRVICSADFESNKDPKKKQIDMFASYF